MKAFFLAILLISSYLPVDLMAQSNQNAESAAVNDDKFVGSIITDPAISRRCEDLLENRKKKILHKNKLLSLLDRNRRLLKSVTPEKVSIIHKLEDNFNDLRRELYNTRQQISYADEDIVKKGCPGIIL